MLPASGILLEVCSRTTSWPTQNKFIVMTQHGQIAFSGHLLFRAELTYAWLLYCSPDASAFEHVACYCEYGHDWGGYLPSYFFVGCCVNQFQPKYCGRCPKFENWKKFFHVRAQQESELLDKWPYLKWVRFNVVYKPFVVKNTTGWGVFAMRSS